MAKFIKYYYTTFLLKILLFGIKNPNKNKLAFQ